MYLAHGTVVVRAAVANHELASSTGDFSPERLEMAGLENNEISANEG